MKERFQIAPYIKFDKDADPTSALVGFSKALSDEDVIFIKDTIKKVDGRDITWDAAEGALSAYQCRTTSDSYNPIIIIQKPKKKPSSLSARKPPHDASCLP